MATPTKTALATLDYSHLGRPFCRVAAQTGLATATLDYSYLGAPFVGAMDEAASGTVAQDLMCIMLMRRKRRGGP